MKIEITNKTSGETITYNSLDKLHKAINVSKDKLRKSLDTENGLEVNGETLILKVLGNRYTIKNLKLSPVEKINKMIEQRNNLELMIEKYQSEINELTDKIKEESVSAKTQIENELSEHENFVKTRNEQLAALEQLVA